MKQLHLTILAGLVLMFAFVGTVFFVPPSAAISFVRQLVNGYVPSSSTATSATGSVLAAHDSVDDDIYLEVNIPAVFNDLVTINGEFVVGTLFAEEVGTSTLVVTSQFTAPNVLYALIADTDSGLEITGTQDMSIINTDKGSSQNIFKTFKVGGDTTAAENNTDTFEFAAGDNIGLSLDTGSKKLTISNTFSLPTQPWALTGSSVHLVNASNTVDIASDLTVSGTTTLNGDVTLGGSSFNTILFNSRLSNGSALLPDTDLGADLGSNSLRFNNIYVANVNTNGSLSTAGQSVFTYEPTSTDYTESTMMLNPTSPIANGFLLGVGVAGFQRAGIDAEGDLILGYNGNISAPATNDPFNVYGHNSTRVAYINTSGDMSLAGSLTVGGSVTLSSGGIGTNFSQGSVVFQGASSLAEDNSNFFWDDTNNRLGIGTASPGSNSKLDIAGAVNVSTGNGYTFQNAGIISGLLGLYESGHSIALASRDTLVVNIDSNLNSSGKYFGIVRSGGTAAGALAATPLFMVRQDGNVGIGTTDPGALLDINNTNSRYQFQNTILQLDSKANGTPFARSFVVKDAGLAGASSAVFGGYGNGTGANLTRAYFGVATTSNDPTGYNSTTLLNILANGNVGIGTTNPLYPLHVDGVAGNINARIGGALITNIPTNGGTGRGLYAGSSDVGLFNWNGPVTVNTGSPMTERMRIGVDGLVGIGTNAPSALLHVASTATTLTNGLTKVDWSPTAAASLNGDLFNINLGANGTVTNLFSITKGGSTLFSVSESKITSAIPHEFTVAGDVSFGYDINLINQTASSINTSGPFSINAGDVYENGTLTLRTYNKGRVIVDSESLLVNRSATVSGKLVLGTTAPVATDFGQLYVTNASTYGKALAVLNQTEGQDIFSASASGTPRFTISNAGDITSVAGAKWQPTANSTSALNIANAAGTPFVSFDTTNQRVGIGTTTPGSTLHVAGTMYINNGNTLDYYSGARGQGRIGYAPTGAYGYFLSPRHLLLQANSSGANGDIIFAQGSTTLGSGELMRIVSSTGFVGIGNIDPQLALHVGSSAIADSTALLRLEDENSSCDFTADTGSPSCGSDLTLKKDISSLSTGDLLSRVFNLRPVSYRWKTQDGNAALQYGFIAQEVEAQFPELVRTGTWVDGTQRKFLNMGGLMPYVIGAVKEQQLQLTELKTLSQAFNQPDSQVLGATTVDENGDLVALEQRVSNLESQVATNTTILGQLQTTIAKLFENATTFLADVTFKGRIFWSPDQTGRLVIPVGATEAKVTFKHELPTEPMVNLTPRRPVTDLEITEVTTTHFVITFAQPLSEELTIDWLATLKDADNEDNEPTVEFVIPSPSPSPTPEPTPSATPGSQPASGSGELDQ